MNLTAGSPYYNPHIQRPALYPPSDGYLPPEDPLIGVARQMEVTRLLKEKFPDLIIVGSAYSYLQDFLPNVAQAAVRLGWVDCVGLGRMVRPILRFSGMQRRDAQYNANGSAELSATALLRHEKDCRLVATRSTIITSILNWQTA